ncbi:unnamed protein product, partial [Symbiodinium microadriaticum]
VDCGCRRPEMSGDDIFCVLKDQLLPMSTQSQCMSYSYTYVVGTLVEWAGAWGRTGGRTLHVEDIVRCVPGMFMIMLADLTIRGMAPVEMDKWPSHPFGLGGHSPAGCHGLEPDRCPQDLDGGGAGATLWWWGLSPFG